MKTLWQLFLSLRRGKQIALCVLLAHFALILALTAQYWFTKKKPIHNRIAVRTFVPHQTVSQTPPQKTKSQPSVKKSASQPIPAPIKKATPTTPSKTASKKEKSSVSAATPTKNVGTEQALLEEIAKGLESLETSVSIKPKEHADISIPTIMPVIAEFSSEFMGDLTFGEKLILFLQNALQLPEYGDVVAQIEISSSGDLVSCEIVESQSQKNGEFLKKKLPELRFPQAKEKASFTITFRNAENP